jgi:MarR family transcriptional regulator, organic hydroperoxide resistance regulator
VEFVAEDQQIPEIDPTANLLVVVAARLNRLTGRVLSRLDIPLTYRQHRLLYRVSQGVTSLAALASYGNLTLPTVSESIDGLVRRGLLIRRPDPEDRRQRHLELTELGRSACTAGQLALGKIMEELINDLPPEHRDVLHETLASVYDAATTHFKADGSR